MHSPEAEGLARDICERLMTNAFGERAERLVLMVDSKGKDVGGRNANSVQAEILAVLGPVIDRAVLNNLDVKK